MGYIISVKNIRINKIYTFATQQSNEEEKYPLTNKKTRINIELSI